MNKRSIWLAGLALLLAGLYANNSSSLATRVEPRPLLLAHRGVHQDFSHQGVGNDSCTASLIFQPRNSFIENTIASMREAIADGADIIEFDVHPTTDGNWAVFHDWTLECRTNGHGVTREQTIGYLKTLDIGYGYTADGGRTFPLRGRGVGLMPTLDEVLTTFPNQRFLIHIKSNDRNEGKALALKIKQLSETRRGRLMVYGGVRPVAVVHDMLPRLRVTSKKTEEECLIKYASLGWSGYVPKACRNSLLIMPVNIGPWLWGWPNKFSQRLASVGTLVFVVDKLEAGGSKGLNSEADLRKLPAGYSGGIWTDQIDVIGPRVAGTTSERVGRGLPLN